MITDYILVCPTNTEFDAMPEDVQQIIKSLGSEWPSFPQPGTQEFNGKKLLHVRMTQLLTKAQLEAMFAAHNLDWQVLSIRSAYQEGTETSVDSEGMAINTPCYITEFLAPKAEFLPYLNPVWDAGTETSRPVELADTVWLSTYAGTEPILLAAP